MDSVVRAITRKIGVEESGEATTISNVRHLELLERAEASLADLLGEFGESAKHGQMPEELVLSRIAETRSILEELTGRRTTDELLEEIFSKFCVGK
jgi:tRNA modification GTPase